VRISMELQMGRVKMASMRLHFSESLRLLLCAVQSALAHCLREPLVNIAILALVSMGLLSAESAHASEAASPSSGAKDYLSNCASCHGETLAGPFGPSLKNEAFRAKWGAKGGGALRNYIAKLMPPANPGGLSEQAYSQIAGFILHENKMSTAKQAATVPAAATPSRAGAPAAGVESGGGVGAAEDNEDAPYRAEIARRANILRGLTPVDEAMLRQPPAEDWLSWRRTDDGLGFSPLSQINRQNVSGLTVGWSLALPSGTNEISPLVHDGVLFVNSNGTVLALEAATGDTLWAFSRQATVLQMGPPVTQPRYMAIFEDRLYVPTSDNHLIALDIHTGKVVWDHMITGFQRTLRITGGPIVVHGKVIQGMAGCGGIGEPGGCFIVALDAKTGAELWRFRTIPRPGEPDGDTWNGAPLNLRFGASIWTAGTYDPENNLVYFGTGQTYHIAALMLPDPTRRPANSGLYTDTTLALNPDTGKLVWHFQHMARDVWDYDWAFERMITTLPIDGHPRKVVMTMGKLGILDVLDAKTGKYIFSHDLGIQTLVTAIDPVTGWKTTDPALEPDSKQPKLICPHSIGVRNWNSTSYDPATQLLYVAASLGCMDLTWLRGELFDITYGLKPNSNGEANYGGVVAINLANRKIEWWRKQRATEASSALGMAGGLVFEGGHDRYFRASDSATGKVLWQVRLDSAPSATPISFAANGVQYVAITSGGGNPMEVTRQPLTPEIGPTKQATTLWVFKLGAAEFQ
jgi:alcohol dehydrogenase (cytochrome c)